MTTTMKTTRTIEGRTLIPARDRKLMSMQIIIYQSDFVSNGYIRASESDYYSTSNNNIMTALFQELQNYGRPYQTVCCTARLKRATRLKGVLNRKNGTENLFSYWVTKDENLIRKILTILKSAPFPTIRSAPTGACENASRSDCPGVGFRPGPPRSLRRYLPCAYSLVPPAMLPRAWSVCRCDTVSGS